MTDRQLPTRLNFKEMKLNHLRMRIMTVGNIMYLVAKIMKKHIGIENAISSDDLFFEIYNKKRQPDYVDDFRWDYVRKAMHSLRQRTKLFIANAKKDSSTYVYFVPTNEIEANHYVDRLENNIKRMRAMQQKAMKSVNEKWYALNWIEESKDLLAYEELYNQENKQKKVEIKEKKGFLRLF